MSGKRRTRSSSGSGKPTSGARKAEKAKALLNERLEKERRPPARVHIAVGYAATGVKTSRRRAEFSAGKRGRRRPRQPLVHDEEPFAAVSRRISGTADRLYRRAAEVAGPDGELVRKAHERRRGRLRKAAGEGSITQRVGWVSAYLWSAYELAAKYGVTADLEPLVTELIELGDRYLKRRTHERS